MEDFAVKSFVSKILAGFKRDQVLQLIDSMNFSQIDLFFLRLD